MPILRKQEISPTQTIGLWNITESVEDFANTVMLSDEEKRFLESISSQERKLQWLASRALLKEMSGGNNLFIAYDQYSKPYIEGDLSLKISISHSHHIVAIILDKKNESGIDIELVKDKIIRITPKFLSSEELKTISAIDYEKATAYWCAKESIYKYYGKKELHFNQNIFIADFKYAEKGLIKGEIKTDTFNANFTLAYEKIEGFMLAYILNNF